MTTVACRSHSHSFAVDEPLRKPYRVRIARTPQRHAVHEYPQVLGHFADLQRAQEPAYNYLATRKDFSGEVRLYSSAEDVLLMLRVVR